MNVLNKVAISKLIFSARMVESAFQFKEVMIVDAADEIRE